jgi:hypothetical protein
VAVNDAHSAIEALCASPAGDQRLQLVRQLTAAALNIAAGSSASFPEFVSCNATCANPSSSTYALSTCESKADGFNNSGDCLADCFPSHGAADSTPCGIAGDTRCTVLSPSYCAVQ